MSDLCGCGVSGPCAEHAADEALTEKPAFPAFPAVGYGADPMDGYRLPTRPARAVREAGVRTYTREEVLAAMGRLQRAAWMAVYTSKGEPACAPINRLDLAALLDNPETS